MKIFNNIQRGVFTFTYCSHKTQWKPFFLVFVFVAISISSCEKALEVDSPRSQIQKNTVFLDDVTAVSATTGMYASIMNSSSTFGSGSNYSITALAALSADEFANLRPLNVENIQFYTNNLISENQNVLNIWSSAYQIIYQANSIVSGLESASLVTQETKEQLKGEALFMRAFCHFYLINMFGEIPIVITTDYRTNTSLKRSNAEAVYSQIINDLNSAQNLLKNTYPSAERVRPNKATVTAMLARVYLYREQWQKAEELATQLIDNQDYQLESDANRVFLSTSREAIWQLQPVIRTMNTYEGNSFILVGSPPSSYLRTDLVNSFEPADSRRLNWVRSIIASGNTYYYPYKYKVRLGGPGSATPVPLTEYSMVFRLGEQYLIRSEARAKRDDLAGAIADIDRIRLRANLDRIAITRPQITKDELLLAIEEERRHELFVEWGHRWLDLKRTGRALNVLSSTKSSLTNTDLLYPVPAKEIINNPNLRPQNLGY